MTSATSSSTSVPEPAAPASEMSAAEVAAVKKGGGTELAATQSDADAPSSEISWRIVCYMYAVGFAISMVLGAIQLSGTGPTNLEGSWLIFVPFGPCLAYALMRHVQQQRQQQKPKTD